MPESLPPRRVDEDVGALEPVANLEAARQEHRAAEPECPDEGPRLGLERADPEDHEHRLGMPRVGAANARKSVG